MLKNTICIIIPIYKEILNEFEIESVSQCLKVLSDYSIHFVCSKELNIDFYKEKFSGIAEFTYFDKYYFKDLAGYNRLMLSVGFYKAFDKYTYMLIHQTDSYVFRDELLDWAGKGFDYVGGIWFENFVGNPYLGAKLWKAGNGGLSLRNIESIISLLNSKKSVKNCYQLLIEKKKLYKKEKINFVKELFLLPLNILGYQNNYKYIAKRYSLNEDFFFITASSQYKKFKIIDVEEAINFSWDRCPAFLYSKIEQLPFACHAWFREDFPYEGNSTFWLQYIST